MQTIFGMLLMVLGVWILTRCGKGLSECLICIMIRYGKGLFKELILDMDPIQSKLWGINQKRKKKEKKRK